MGALAFVVVSLVLYFLAYKFYATYLAEKIWRLDPNAETPATKYDDGFEFVPTRTDVVAGHHFTSIAGAAPIVGPVVAAIWGWLPGLLWIVLGTIFFGAVHDFGTLVMSLRKEGRGIADFMEDLLGKWAMRLMYIVIFFILVLVSAVFVHVVTVLSRAFPAAVVALWIEIPLALIIGIMLRKNFNINIYVAAGIAVAIMYSFIWVGLRFEHLLEFSYQTWVIILLAYMFIASRLPVWLLVQPRDFINGLQLIIALTLASVAVVALAFTGGGQLVAPVVEMAPEGAPPIWPFLFIVIACGAISGWHSIVGTGTTPKQLKSETAAKPVGYGSMLAEGYLAVIALITAVVGLGAAGYAQFYGSWGAAAWPVVWAQGGGNILAALGIPTAVAAAFMAVVAKSFAMTTLDSAMRFTRIAFAESVKTFGLPKILADRTISIIPGFLVIALLAWPQAATGSGYGMVLWPLFGATNQILASLALLASGVFLMSLGRSTINYIIPFVLLLVTSMTAMGHSLLFNYIPNQQWPLVVIGSVVFLSALGVLVISIMTYKDRKKIAAEIDVS